VPFNGTRVMVRKEVIQRIGGFRIFFKGLGNEDFDWILRIAQHYRLANIPDVLYEYKYYPRSASKITLTSPARKIFINDLTFFLAQQRTESGTDAIETENFDQIDSFLAPLSAKLESDTTNRFVYGRLLKTFISNKDFKNTFEIYIARVGRWPLQLTNITDLMRIIAALAKTALKAAVYRVTNRSKYSLNDY
jgi:hypothetical protein